MLDCVWTVHSVTTVNMQRDDDESMDERATDERERERERTRLTEMLNL